MLTNTDKFQLKKTVGSSWITDKDDVEKTKSALNQTGDYKAPEWGITGIPDKEMFDGLKSFQKREGLEVDGVMKPGGPTETRLSKKTEKASSTKSVTTSQEQQKTGINALRGIAEGEWDKSRPGMPKKPERDEQTMVGGSGWPEVDWLKTPPFNYPPNSGEETKKRRGKSDRDRSHDVQIALAPLLPAIAAGGAALMRHGPQALRGLENIIKSAPPLVGAVDHADKQPGKPKSDRGQYPSPIPEPPDDEDSKTKRANMDSADPLPPSPGFEASDAHIPNREEFPAERDIGPTTEIFPNPGQREAILETFPIDDSLSRWIVMENSRGDDETQAKTDILIELYTDAYKRRGIKAKHLHGGRTAERKEKRKERYIKPTDGIGAARPDGSFQIGEREDNAWDDFNTVDNLVDGVTPSARERRALEKIRGLYKAHGEKSSIADYPKLRGMSLEEFREVMRPLVEQFLDAGHGKK